MRLPAVGPALNIAQGAAESIALLPALGETDPSLGLKAIAQGVHQLAGRPGGIDEELCLKAAAIRKANRFDAVALNEDRSDLAADAPDVSGPILAGQEAGKARWIELIAIFRARERDFRVGRGVGKAPGLAAHSAHQIGFQRQAQMGEEEMQFDPVPHRQGQVIALGPAELPRPMRVGRSVTEAGVGFQKKLGLLNPPEAQVGEGRWRHDRPVKRIEAVLRLQLERGYADRRVEIFRQGSKTRFEGEP